MGLGSGSRRGDRGVEDGTALRDFGGALRHEPPHVFRRHPGAAQGGHTCDLPTPKGCAVTSLRQPALSCARVAFGEGGRGAARALLAEVLEVAPE